MKASTKTIDLKNIVKSSWKPIRFEKIASKISETVDPGSTTLNTYIGLEHIDAEDIHIRRSGTPDDVSGGKLKCYPGDVVFGKRRAYQRKAAIVDFEGICSAHAFVFRANPEIIDPKLFPFFLHSDQFMHRMVDISVGGLSPTINWGDLKNQEFLLPPKDQQAQLAELLWAFDEVIEREKEVLDKLRMFMFKKREFFFIKGSGTVGQTGFSNFTIPSHWQIKKMSDVAEVEYGISESVANNTDPSIGWQILTGANINLDGSFNLEKKRYIEVPTNKRFLLEKGDLMFNWRSGSPEHIGKTAIFDLIGNYTYASFILKIRCGDFLNNRYAYYLLNYLREIEYFTKNIAQQVNFKINASIFREIEIPIPPIEEQFEIQTILDKIYYQLLELESKIASSQSLQKSLINQIF